MVLDQVFERFAAGSPVSVMVRGTLEYALAPQALDALFERTAARQYTKELLFSSVVDLMSLVVCKIRPAVHAAYQALADRLPVSLTAVYDKLARMEPAVSAALVRETAQRLAPLVGGRGEREAWLPGYRVKVLDGNYLARTQHRLKELRGTRAAALPGMSVVVLDPQALLAVDYFPCASGHAPERSLLGQVLATARPGEVWLGDRNFCTTDFLAGLRQRGAHFLVRQHRATVTWEALTPLRRRGRTDGGAVFEQPVRLTNVAGEPVVRRVVVRLDRPARGGDTELWLLADLAEGAAGGVRLAEVYRKRWTIAGLFQDLTQTLACEVETLGYPKAALFAFAVALVASNVLAVVKAALRAAHGAEKVEAEVSGYYVAEEVSGTYRGLMVAIPAEHWAPFRDAPLPQLAALLRRLAAGVRLAAFRKHPRGPKKPAPKRPSCGRYKHVATAKLLAQRKAKKKSP
jgi:hypothetical protein